MGSTPFRVVRPRRVRVVDWHCTPSANLSERRRCVWKSPLSKIGRRRRGVAAEFETPIAGVFGRKAFSDINADEVRLVVR